MATDDLEQVGTTNRGSNLALDVELDEDASPPHSPMGDGTDSNSDGPSPTRTQPSTPRKDPVPVHCVDHIRSTSTLTRVLILVGLLGIVAVVIVVAVLLPSWLAGSTDQPCAVVIGTRHGSRYPHTAATSFDATVYPSAASTEFWKANTFGLSPSGGQQCRNVGKYLKGRYPGLLTDTTSTHVFSDDSQRTIASALELLAGANGGETPAFGFGDCTNASALARGEAYKSWERSNQITPTTLMINRIRLLQHEAVKIYKLHGESDHEWGSIQIEKWCNSVAAQYFQQPGPRAIFEKLKAAQPAVSIETCTDQVSLVHKAFSAMQIASGMNQPFLANPNSISGFTEDDKALLVKVCVSIKVWTELSIVCSFKLKSST